MAFQVSAGINVSEIDLTTTVPSIATTAGAIGGVFGWGPVGKFLSIDTESTLAARYGRPTNNNYETFFTAANFLSYGNQLYVSRAAVTTGFANTVPAANVAMSSGDTTILLTGNGFSVATGHAVYGEGIQQATVVVSADAANSTGGSTGTLSYTKVVVSLAPTSDTDSQLNFFNNNYSFNAVANSSPVNLSNFIVKNKEHYDTITFNSGVEYVARYPGVLGSSLKVSSIDSATQYRRSIDMKSNTSVGSTASTYRLDQLSSASISINVNTSTANVALVWDAGASVLTYAETKTTAQVLLQSLTVGDYIEIGNSSIGTQYMKIKSLPSTVTNNNVDISYFTITFEEPYKLSTNYSSNTLVRDWEYYNVVSSAPGTSQTVTSAGSTVVDQVSLVVADEDGSISGNPGTVLEVFQNLSRATDAKNSDGSTNYYKTVINENSQYIWFANDRTGAVSNTAALVANSTVTTPYTKSLVGGRDGLTESAITNPALASAYDLFGDPSTVDISLVMAGRTTGGTNGEQSANYLIDNVAEKRKDCVVFVSPQLADVLNNQGQEASAIVTFRGSVRNSSYAVVDSGYKYQYDKYNDVYRWVPLNGDIAGLTARSDLLRDPWFSPAGFNRGQIKNVVKLAYNPSKGDRDTLYKNDVNPVVTFPGQGTILYGDKTALGRSSAFDRINVRRLFIGLEKTIATAAQSMLFEFNDEFTRSQFRNLIEPYLRDVQGRRGIYDFRVVCDDSNNTQEVVDSNRFVGDIYIKPAKSINFIQLNFVAVRSGVEFTEVVGQF